MSLEPGTLLRGRYEIVRLIKSGGMGSVCEARDTNLANSPCAIKEVLESALEGQHGDYIRETFEKEMKALVELDHPCIPKVRDFFKEGERRYIVMEYVKGRSLEEETMEHVEDTGKALPPGKVVADTLQLLDTVSYLHHLKPPILHRDIKPANMIRDEKSGRVKLVDFGLAKAVSETLSPQTMVGTMGFCAPEQLSGRADVRSDLYSVAATMFQMLSGQAPQLTFDPLQLVVTGLRPGLDRIIAKGTEPRASDRYQRAEDMASDLRAWQAGLPTAIMDEPSASTSTPSDVQPAPLTIPNEPPEKTPQWAWLAVVGLATGVGLLVGKVGSGSSTASTPTPTIQTSATPESIAAVLSPTPISHASDPGGSGKHPSIKATRSLPPPPIRRHPRPLPTQPRPAETAEVAHVKVPSVDDSGAYPQAVGEAKITGVHAETYRFDQASKLAEMASKDERPQAFCGTVLNQHPELKEDWAYNRELTEFVNRKVNGSYWFIGMRGRSFVGGYFLRPAQAKVVKLVSHEAQDLRPLVAEVANQAGK